MSLEVNVTKRFDGFTLHAAFTAGDTATALLGASGCGKSMTLRCIAGIVRPDEGRIVLDGRVLFDSAQGIDLPPQQRNVGLLFQNYALFPNMTVEQNILSVTEKGKRPCRPQGCLCRGIAGYAARRNWPSACPARFQADSSSVPPWPASWRPNPAILMLDEPFSALDSYLREEVEGEVGSLLAGFAGTALLVTHNRDEAYRLCREMIVMDSGEVLRVGTTKEVFADPRTRAAARLTGCKNILPCTRVGEHTVHLAGWEQPLTVALPVPEGCRAVGIRAHDFAPCAPGTPNSLPVQAVSTSENPFDWNMIFTLPGGEARLWWKVSKETMAAPPPKAPACLAAAPENIMPLV